MEALADAVGLRAVGLGLRMVDVLDGQVKLVGMVLDLAAVFGAPIRKHALNRNAVFCIEGDYPIVEYIGSRDPLPDSGLRSTTARGAVFSV